MASVAQDNEHESRMGIALRRTTKFCTRNVTLTLVIAAVSVVACSIGAFNYLSFKTDRSDLINPSAQFHQRWLKYTENFGDAGDMVVVVESSEPESIKQAVDRLGQRLKQEPQVFANVLYKIEPGSLRSKGLQYLSPPQLEEGLERLDEYQPILNGNWDLVRTENISTILWRQLEAATAASDAKVADSLLQHAERFANSLDGFLRDSNEFSNPWPDLIALNPEQRDLGQQTIYLINDAGTFGFVRVAPVKSQSNFEGATGAIDRIRMIMAEVKSEVPDTKLSLTGIPVLENDEMRRSKTDMGWASLISESGVLILMLVCFRGFRHPLVGMLMLAIGTAWTFGFTTAVVGHLNILSVSFVTILIGLGVDFGIHFLARYLQLRHEGTETKEALVETSGQVGTSIVTGAVTSALAFFCAAFTDFVGVAELGIIAGGGILLCTVATFTVLPAMVVIADQNRRLEELPKPFRGEAVRWATGRMPTGILIASAIVIAVIISWNFEFKGGQIVSRLRYDHNLLNLQAKGIESVDTQTRIFQASNHSLLFAVSMADSAEEARQLKAQFEALPTVHHVEELASRLPIAPASQTKLMVQAFYAQLARLPESPPPPSVVNPAVVGRNIEQLYRHLLQRPEELARRIAVRLDHVLSQLDGIPLPEQMQRLAEFQYRVSFALLAQLQAIATAANPEPVSLDDLPSELTSRYVSRKGLNHGKWLVQIFPAEQVWDMAPLTRFVNEVRSVDPDVTGTPLQNFEAALQIKHSYEIAAMYALAVIGVVLLIDFLPRELLTSCLMPPAIVAISVAATLKFVNAPLDPLLILAGFLGLIAVIAAVRSPASIGYTLLAMVPPVVSLGMTFGILVLINMPLNPANLIILPLILGLGVDSGVHLLHDFRCRTSDRYVITPSLVNAIVLTVTTTMVGFGAMMIAAHRGLFSLGAVLTIGLGCCLFVSLVPLPAMLSLMSHFGKRQGLRIAAETLPHLAEDATARVAS
jgi:uncharacterized protein